MMSVHFWGEKTSVNDSSVWKLLVQNAGDRPATLKSWSLTFYGTKEDPQPDVPIITEVLPEIIVDQPKEKSGELEVVDEEEETIKSKILEDKKDEKVDVTPVDEKTVEKKVDVTPVDEKTVEKKVDELTVEKKVDELTVEKKVDELTVEKIVDEKIVTDKEVDETTIKSETKVENNDEETVTEEEEAQESQTVAR
jgi:hypothetical protein